MKRNFLKTLLISTVLVSSARYGYPKDLQKAAALIKKHLYPFLREDL